MRTSPLLPGEVAELSRRSRGLSRRVVDAIGWSIALIGVGAAGYGLAAGVRALRHLLP